MTKRESNLTWAEIDPTTLNDECQLAYNAYKDLYRSMKAARLVFEVAVNEAVNPPAGKRVVCGYNFGKLSIALADDDRKPAKATVAKQSLADFLASAQASGRRM